MTLRIKLFAVARQLAGSDQLDLELPEGATVAQLRAKLVERVPALAGAASMLLIAVNQDYVDDHYEIPAGADVACIPPVSGG